VVQGGEMIGVVWLGWRSTSLAEVLSVIHYAGIGEAY
jgi:hypothetical protein